MYQVNIDDEVLYLPGDKNYIIDSPVLDLSLGESGSFTFTCPKINPRYESIYNRKSMISVFYDGNEIFYGEVRNQEKDFYGNKKVSCVGVLGFLADTIQPQEEYHDMTPREMLSAFLTQHNKLVDERKQFYIGTVTVVDANDSLYRYSNFETTLECIKDKLVNRLGGYLVVRHENNKLYLDWLNIEDIGSTSTQSISFGMNLLDYTEDLSADDIATALIPLGAEIESDNSSNEILKQYVDIVSVNDGKNYIVSNEACQQFGWVCAVEHWDDVNVPSNLLRKGREWLKNNQFENITLSLTAVDLSLLSTNFENIKLGDKVRCVAKPYGMDRYFPVLKLSIPLLKPAEAKIELGQTKTKGYVEQVTHSYHSLSEETAINRKVTNEKIKNAVDNLTSLMNKGQGGYKLTEYDSQGRWLRDLYMDTMDKNTATKVLQVNLNGIGGSKNGYSGPYNVGMTLDGQIMGERIVANSITAEKLAVSYTSQVEKNINDAKDSAISSANSSTDNKLKNYYTMSEVNTKLSATDGKIEASVNSLNQNLLQKNGNYYGGYIPTASNAPANSWNTNELKKLHEGDFFFDTSTGYAYRYVLENEVYKITFSSNSRTEGTNYDYVKFFYQIDGKTYATKSYGGTDIANSVLYIPTNVFWVYWKTDSSDHNYYGFRISSIEKVKCVYTESGTISSLPSDTDGITLISGSNYPESAHSPYSDNEKKLWKYTGDSLSTSLGATWQRIKDSDINSNEKAIKDRSGNYYADYVPTTSNAPASSWNTTEVKDLHVGDMFYNTVTGYAYRYASNTQCLKITFSSDSRTEGSAWDYVQIYYEKDGITYTLPKIGGTDIKNAVVYVPVNKFYFYWRTDTSSSNFYGFKITNIEKAYTSQEITGTVTALPTDGGDTVVISGSTYPESEHNPYGDNVRKLWQYTSSQTISTSKNYGWERIQDQDIEIAKTKAEEAISRITVAEDSITSMVKKGEFGTYMQQNYNSFLLGFNAASKYIQIKAGEIGLYNGSVSNTGKRAVMNENGFNFYRDNYYVGTIGTNQYSGNSSHKGLVFDLEYEGKYMAFAQKESSSATSYKTMLCFSRANSIYDEYGLHLGCNLYCHGFKIISPKWEDGWGTTATINYVQVLEVDSSGTITKWGANGRMVFKNGILMDLTYY